MRRAVAAIGLVILAGTVVAAVGTYWLYSRVHSSVGTVAADGTFIEIAPGSGPATIGRQLVESGLVVDQWTFRAALWLSGQARTLKAGEYFFDRPQTPLEVLDKIARGDIYRRQLTFREGLTIREMARVYGESGLGQAADFLRAARDPSRIRSLDSTAEDLEGYLFPNTYSLGRNSSPDVLVAMMVEQFTTTLTPNLLAGFAAEKLTVREAVTIASLVEKETAVAEERPLVAAVYLNRRRVGMPMQADPTVIYALEQAGRYNGNIRRVDLQFDSPYNTYRYPGLPPGPIAAPGRAALAAVAAPADVDYLYFVSRNDGSHAFATTLSEHNRNVQRFQVRYFQRNR